MSATTASSRDGLAVAPRVGPDRPEVVRVCLVDDHAKLRGAVRRLLESTHRAAIVGECGTATEAVRLILRLRPDVAVVDVLLPDGSGVTVCRVVRAADPRIQVVMITTVDDAGTRQAARAAGATSFVIKHVRGVDLVEAVLAAAAPGGNGPGPRPVPAPGADRASPTPPQTPGSARVCLVCDIRRSCATACRPVGPGVTMTTPDKRSPPMLPR